VALGVAAGLFLGKPLGVFGAIALLCGLKLTRRPMGTKWVELFGMSLLTGVGFTMSLYIGELAFPLGGMEQGQVRAGVIAGSLLSTLAGMGVLAWAQTQRRGSA
jgi:Na+:H+ antiporter, NhaA family